MKNSFITEMMWEILYVGNMQFPKIEAGQNQFNYLGINTMAFLLTHGGQWKLFKAAENKCQRAFVQAVESIPICPGDNEIDTGYLKKYFFHIIGKMKCMSSQVLSIVLEQFVYLDYVEFFGLTFQTSVGTWYISSTPFSLFKIIPFLMPMVSTLT